MKRPWKLSYYKLLYFQKKIQYTKDKRFCRNFQRLLRRTSFIQLFIIHKFKINFILLSSKKYRFFFKLKIYYKLWVFSIFPILKKKKNQMLRPENIKILYSIFQKPQYIVRVKNFFNIKNKYWILSNLLIEKKFFLKVENWKYFSKSRLSLKTIFKTWTILNFDKSIVKYNRFIIFSSRKIKDFEQFIQIQGCQIKFKKFYYLDNTKDLSRWLLFRNNPKISLENFKNFKKECQKVLNKNHKNQQIDKVIHRFTLKILNWQRFYNRSFPSDILFMLIWNWLKKRHKKKSSKWLYNIYWKNSIIQEWIFSINRDRI
uniref:Group II intron maturase-specific domain-containing protein n=1 Tax=Callipsygma wilsonis TaxID=2320807 RepID=A0A386AZX3_9CHLO|nr:hypothetical protein [Callipsygma wilsonis]AYC64995.1 hypothetical protein [Callipsygma wilsonis]